MLNNIIRSAKIKYLKSLTKDEKGQGMVEYALIIGLVSVVVIGALVLLGEDIGNQFDAIVEKLNPSS